MACYALLALLVALCSGQTASPTTSPCSAPPGYFCSGGTALLCPIGAYCAGGAALNASCAPLTACTVAGLSAQPPCYWIVSTFAGNGVAAYANGRGLAASFNDPRGISTNSSGFSFVVDLGNSRVRLLSPAGDVTFLAGSGSLGWVDGIGAAASFNQPTASAVLNSTHIFVADTTNNRLRYVVVRTGFVGTFAGDGFGSPASGRWLDGVGTSASFFSPSGLAFDRAGNGYIADGQNHRIRRVSPSAVVTTFCGTGAASYADGPCSTAAFNFPFGVAVDSLFSVYVVEHSPNNFLRRIFPNGTVHTLVGSSSAAWADGFGAMARFYDPLDVALDTAGTAFIADFSNNRIRMVKDRTVTTIGGNGAAAWNDGFGTASSFNGPRSLSVSQDGTVLVVDDLNHRIRKLACVPCPASYYCLSGAPALCPAGSYCALSSINATPCPAGSFSNAGASSCTPCLAGTFASTTGSPSCQKCTGGHYCPAGTSSWARTNCGRGFYCPDGSSGPTPCPFQVPPSGGWGALKVQGPAFLVETAHCLNHCFWNSTSGDGTLSKC